MYGFSSCPLIREPSFITKFQTKFLGFHSYSKNLAMLPFYQNFVSKQFFKILTKIPNSELS